MPIIRVSKDKNNPYLTMNKTGLDDKRLSNSAKGLLAVLLSKPDNWYINYRNLATLSTDSMFSITSSINKLIKLGYVHKFQVRSSNGKYSFYDYTVYERPTSLTPLISTSQPKRVKPSSVKPSSGKPSSVKPSSGKPNSGKPNSGNRVLLNNNIKISNKTTTTPISVIPGIPVVDSSFSKLNKDSKKSKIIPLLNDLNIKNHNKLFDLFDLNLIFIYSTWINDNNFKINNPTGFLISAIREGWDTSKVISSSSRLQTFTKKCLLCDTEFSFKDYGDFHLICPSCLFKD